MPALRPSRPTVGTSPKRYEGGALDLFGHVVQNRIFSQDQQMASTIPPSWGSWHQPLRVRKSLCAAGPGGREGSSMAQVTTVYLDIETSWDREITMVGFQSSATGLVQLVGSEVTERRLSKELPRSGRLYTYNGHCFDLPEIRKQLGLDLRKRFKSRDLRWICQNHRIKGGQKKIEHRAKFYRKTKGMDGDDARDLWDQHGEGDAAALPLLRLYNAEDVKGIKAIKQYAARRGFLRGLDDD